MKTNNLKPHQSRYFSRVTDPDFFPKMDHLVKLYKNPPENLFFFDECPGIQILKRLLPDLRTDETKKRLEEFEYIRNGTMNVLAFKNYKNGKVFAECQADHKTDTFIEVFKRHSASCPDKEQIHYVMDNLSTHRSYPFRVVVAELSNVTCPPEKELNSLEKRVEWLTSANRFEISSLTKQLKLMLNLLNEYVSEIPIKYWKNLFDTFKSQEATLRQLIQEESVKRREKAVDALNLIFGLDSRCISESF